MDIVAELEKLDSLISRLSVYVVVDTEVEWTALQSTLDGLEAEAKNFSLPWGNVSQYAARLRHHLGALLGKAPDGGHTHEQHVVWAIGDMEAMRSDHAFAPALERLSQGPSGAIH